MTCDHKFIDSTRCLKCGWEPNAAAIASKTPFRVVSDEEAEPKPEHPAELVERVTAALTTAMVVAHSRGEQVTPRMLALAALEAIRPSPAPLTAVFDMAPNANGWWLRVRGGREKWFEVKMLSETGEPPLSPKVYLRDLQRHVEVSELTDPLDDWYGPVVVPEMGEKLK